jgi:hypothetical protein
MIRSFGHALLDVLKRIAALFQQFVMEGITGKASWRQGDQADADADD